MKENIKKIIEENYNLKVNDIKQVKGGWAALAFVIKTENHKYFLKLYDMSRASSITYTKYIDEYVSILLQLNSLKNNITIPVLTKDNKSCVKKKDYTYLLFENINGETVAEKKLTDSDKLELANIINKLHKTKVDINCNLPEEDFVIDTATKLKRFIENPTDNEVLISLNNYIEKLFDIMNYLEEIAKEYKNKNVRKVLCHTDIHTYNMMKDNNHLWLIDWEGLKLSPRENDLALLDSDYKQFVLDNYYNKNIDDKLMVYYPLKRKIDDIWEWVELLVVDKNIERREEYLDSLKEELKNI